MPLAWRKLLWRQAPVEGRYIFAQQKSFGIAHQRNGLRGAFLEKLLKVEFECAINA
jgi:hypothetical protein